MSDLFGNHIVGFPTRRLIYKLCLNLLILYYTGVLKPSSSPELKRPSSANMSSVDSEAWMSDTMTSSMNSTTSSMLFDHIPQPKGNQALKFHFNSTKKIFWVCCKTSCIIKYCKFGNIHENLIFAYICKCVKFLLIKNYHEPYRRHKYSLANSKTS